MGTLAAGFLVAWVAVAAYVGWIGVQQRRLCQRLDAAEQRAPPDVTATRSRAA